ncbi:BlaI/MecI/CopY family transcriptional regulator [Streptomyces gamaensis]|uniref:BlaI/MecI/CopY family transcriptional regulator n=1 Tax=Streptomyces gamaensis TaxID=1763542 RepID=A0ABW0YYE7_9ACTN
MGTGPRSEPENSGKRRANGQLEAEVLQLLQQAAPQALTPGEVRERLSRTLAYTTVVTICSRLHAKGLLTRARRSRAFAYTPVTDEAGLAARKMHQALGGESDREAVLARFVDDLSDSDEEALRRLLGHHLDPGR